jgi:hypothetical protein
MFSTETATTAVKTTLASSSFWTWILYILGFVIIVLAVLMLSGYKFNTDIFGFLRSSKMSIDAASTVFWKPSEQYGALIVREKEMSKDFKNTRFTMLIDMVWFDTRTMLKNGPYRHILHKGSDELKSLKDDGDSKMVFENGMQTSSCTVSHSADSFGNLPPNGLPKRMNPGIFADPVTNDMIIFIDTEFDNKRMRESMRVPDIPLGTPFRLALVVADHFMEVYINCRLDSTKILRGMPLDVDPEWYGLSGPASLPAMIQNLKIWNYPLSSHDIKTQCPSIPEFKLSKACATKMKETATEAAPAAAPTGISYGNTLGKC